MQHLLDEYGETILGIVGAFLVIGIAYALFENGGIIEEYLSNIANSSIWIIKRGNLCVKY